MLFLIATGRLFLDAAGSGHYRVCAMFARFVQCAGVRYVSHGCSFPEILLPSAGARVQGWACELEVMGQQFPSSTTTHLPLASVKKARGKHYQLEKMVTLSTIEATARLEEK